MKNKTKYFIVVLFMLVTFLLIGTNKVNAAESGIVYDVDLGTVNVGYTDAPSNKIIIHNNGTETWGIMKVEVDNEDVFNINGTFIGQVEPAYDSYGDYNVSAKTELPAGTYTGKITVTTWSGLVMSANVTLKVVDPDAQNNVLVTNATEFINATNKTNAEDSADVIKLQNDINMDANEINWNIYKDAILDLNGNTLTLNDDKAINLIYHDNATLKIIDSSAGKTGRIYKNDNNINYDIFTIKENDSNVKHNIGILADGVKIERTTGEGDVFNGKDDYKLTIKDTTFTGSSFIISNEDNVKVDLKIETMQIFTYEGNMVHVIYNSDLKIKDAISDDSELLYYAADENDGWKYKQVVADGELSLSAITAYYTDSANPRNIIVRKKTGFDVTNINLNETYGYTSSTDVKEISIYNRGVTDLQIKNVSVDSANFQIENGNQATLNAGETDTSWKIKAKAGLAVGTYTANITVTDMNDNTYITTVTLVVGKKEITDHNISMESWTYGDTEKNYVLTPGSSLSTSDCRIKYANADSDSWSIAKPSKAGSYKVRLQVVNDNYIAEDKIAYFEIYKNDTEIKIVPKSNSWTYDGNDHKESGYDVYYGGTLLDSYMLPISSNGNYVEARISGTVRDVADTVAGNNVVSGYEIVNGSGCFSNIKVETGTLTITPITTPIVVTAGSADRGYNGTELTNNNYTYTNDVLLPGDILTATITGSQKYVGNSDNVVSNVKVERGNKDITSNYTFGTHINGTLKVNTELQTVDVTKNLYVRIGKTLTIEQIKALLNCNHTDYSIRFEGGTAGTFDSTTGFTAGSSEGQVQFGAIVPAKDINGDGVNEYAETGTSFFINVVNKENVTISGLTDNQEFTFDNTTKTPWGTGTITVEGNKVDVNELEIFYKGTGSTTYNSKFAPVDAGTYTITYKVKDSNPNYVGSVTYAFTIKKAQLNKVVLNETSYEYTGSEIVSDQGNFDSNKMDFSGDNKATNVGNYSITVSLKDKNNYEWKDGTINDLVLNWSIVQATPRFTVPTNLTSVKGKVLADVTLPTGFTWNAPATVLTAGRNTYKATFTPEDTTNYKTVTDIDVTVVVKDLFDVITSVPGGNGTITPSKIGVLEGNKVKITFTPNTGYMIDKVLVNGTEQTVTGNEIEITVNEYKEVEVSYKKIPFTITVENVEGATVDPGGVVTVNYGDNKNFTITANWGYKLIKVLVNGTEKTLDGNTLKLTNITANMNIKVVVEKIVYEVTEGANQKYTITENTEARFKINADYSLFDGKVYIDNVLVNSDNYTSESGSTIITFKQAYVDTLSVGEHALKVVFTDGGEATTKFEIAKKVEENNNNDNNNNNNDNGNNNNNDNSNNNNDNEDNNNNKGSDNNNENTNTPSKTENEEKKDNISSPKTGDNFMLYITIVSMSVLGLGATIIVTKKKKMN